MIRWRFSKNNGFVLLNDTINQGMVKIRTYITVKCISEETHLKEEERE